MVLGAVGHDGIDGNDYIRGNIDRYNLFNLFK